MAHDFFEGEDLDRLNAVLIALSKAIEKIFSFADQSEEVKDVIEPEVVTIVKIQALAQLLANYIEMVPEEDREEVRQFVKDQQDLVYTLRADQYQEIKERTPEDIALDPYGLAKMEPQGRA